MTSFDPVAYTLNAHDAAALSLTFRATDRQRRKRGSSSFGPRSRNCWETFPRSGLPAAADARSQRLPWLPAREVCFRKPAGRRGAGLSADAEGGQGALAAVVCVPGHGRGVDDIVGIDDKGQDRTVKVGYAYDYAIQVVEHGMAAVAIEPMAFGCRRDARTKAHSLETSACQPVAGSALLLGQTIIGWRVYEIMRTIDWIGSRKELDAKRVGCMGCSGGGMATVFAAALDTRIQAALVSSYLNTFRDSVMSISHCIDNYVPGILNWAEMYDVAGLIAPRPLFVESGERDNIFPIAASRASFQRVRRCTRSSARPAIRRKRSSTGRMAFRARWGCRSWQSIWGEGGHRSLTVGSDRRSRKCYPSIVIDD